MRPAMHILLVTVLFCLSIEADSAQGGRDLAREFEALPEYCRYTMLYRDKFGNSEQAGAVWKMRLGPEWNHMHHYCTGLLHINRARSSVSKEREKWYRAALPEIDYVIRAVREGYALMPEFLTRKGEALTYLRNFREAEEALQKAIALKPDYWPAYTQLATSFVARNDVDAARDVLKQGLGRVQEPRMLQKMLDDLNKPRQ